jgi:hypothetical protein
MQADAQAFFPRTKNLQGRMRLEEVNGRADPPRVCGGTAPCVRGDRGRDPLAGVRLLPLAG